MTRTEMIATADQLGPNDMCPFCRNAGQIACCEDERCGECDGEGEKNCYCQDA